MKINVDFVFNGNKDSGEPIKIIIDGRENTAKEIYNDLIKLMKEKYHYFPL